MPNNSDESLIRFQKKFFISENPSSLTTINPNNDWINACIYLGQWTKNQYRSDARRITFAVLPSRDCVSAFISIGALIASVSKYKDELSWEKFSSLELRKEIYWKRIESTDWSIGEVMGVELIGSEYAIRVKNTKSRRVKDIGASILIPKGQFKKFLFSIEKPASSSKETAINSSMVFLEHLIGGLSPAWSKSDGQDLLLVTNMIQFKSTILHLYAGIIDSELKPIKLEYLLGFEQLGNGKHSKLKISHPKGELESHAELVILDGPSAFSIKEHIPLNCDLLIIFNSMEFRENELDFINEIKSASESVNGKHLSMSVISEKFPIGIEISSYVFPR